MKVETYKTKHTLIQKNPLTGDYLLTALDGANSNRLQHQNYYATSKGFASQMAQTMDHYEETGDKKQFPVNLRYIGKMTIIDSSQEAVESVANIHAACQDALEKP